MLVLTRQRDESVMIGDEVEVVVVGLGNGDRVQLSVTAPPHIPIRRKEVNEPDQRPNPPADGQAPDAVPDLFQKGEHGRPEPQAPARDARGTRLVLTRRRDETIVIGDDVEVTVVETSADTRSNKVRLGISAPRHVPVHRKEVYEAIARAHQQGGEAHTTPSADTGQPIE